MADLAAADMTAVPPDPAGCKALLDLLSHAPDDRHSRPATARLESTSWEDVIAWAQHHRVVPQLYRRLAGNRPVDMEPALWNELARHAKVLSLNARYMAAELMRLLRLFADEEIPVVAFKGPVLADLAYGEVAAREFGDLDLLVHESDYARAKELLLERGLSLPYSEQHEQRVGQAQLFSASGRLSVDLHQRLAIKEFAGLASPDEPWRVTTPHSMAGGTLTTFTPPATLVLTSLQAAKAHWGSLYHFCDMAALAQTHGDACVAAALELASHWRVRRMLLLGLRAAEDLLGLPLAPDIRRAAERDRAVARLIPQIRAGIFGAPSTARVLQPKHRLHLLLQDRARDRIHYALRISPTYVRLAFKPNQADRSCVSLPARLRFLYSLVRPLRLLVTFARRRRGRTADTAHPPNPI